MSHEEQRITSEKSNDDGEVKETVEAKIPSAETAEASTPEFSENLIKKRISDYLAQQSEHFKHYEFQKEEIWKICKILASESDYVFETSSGGMGKTLMCLLSGLACGFDKIVVICPKMITDKWDKYLDIFNDHLKYRAVISYHSFAGVGSIGRKEKNYEVFKSFSSSQWLVSRRFVEKPKGKDDIEFQLSACGKLLVEKGTFFIFDEFQNMKNDETYFHKACSAIIREILGTETRSRFIMSSFTPADTIEKRLNFLNMLGIIDDDLEWAVWSSKSEKIKLTYKGKNLNFQTLHDHCAKFDRKKSNEILTRILAIDSSQKMEARRTDFINEYFEILVEHLVTRVPSSVVGKIYNEMVNGQVKYFFMDTQKDNDEFIKLAPKLDKGTKVSTGRGDAQKSITRFEELMIENYVKETSSIVRQNTGAKIIIAMNRKTGIFATLKKRLEETCGCKVGIIDPENKNNHDIISEFNEPNLDMRIIIGTIQILKEGLDLHDTHGKFPRFLLTSPTYRAVDFVQMIYRIVRLGLKSTAHIVVMYPATIDDDGKAKKHLDKITTSISEKTEEFNRMLKGDELILTKFVDNIVHDDKPRWYKGKITWE